jgi:uncharacterized ferredoxin-like protein
MGGGAPRIVPTISLTLLIGRGTEDAQELIIGRPIYSTMTVKDTVRMVGDLMELAARTAPKGLGQDFIEAKVLSDDECVALGNDMLKVAEERSIPGFTRDGKNVLDSSAVVIIGLLPHKGAGLNCGGCGYASCAEFLQQERPDGEDFRGPSCIFQMIDLGIALGVAAKVAGELCIDNRMMYTIGAAARKIRALEADVVIGFPLSTSGKNPYFDRG